jgi:hypothetical protein
MMGWFKEEMDDHHYDDDKEGNKSEGERMFRQLMDGLGNRFPDPENANLADVISFIMDTVAEMGMPAADIGMFREKLNEAENIMDLS